MAEAFKNYRIYTRILDKLQTRKAQLARGDSLTAFIGWILELYAEGKLVDIQQVGALRTISTNGKMIVAARVERQFKGKNERQQA